MESDKATGLAFVLPWHQALALAGLVALLALVFWQAMSVATAGGTAPPLDDTFIYFQYARAIARGEPFSYTPGAPLTMGATSLLYPFLLAPAFVLGLDDAGALVYGYALNAALLLASALGVHFLATSLVGRKLALVAVLLTLLCGPVLWGFFSMMEIGLFSTVLLLTCCFLKVEGRSPIPWKALTTSSLLPFCRPEGVFMAGLVVLLVAARQAPALLQEARWLLRSRASRRALGVGGASNGGLAWLRPASVAILLLPVLASAGMLLTVRATTGTFLMNTILSKSIQFTPQATWFDKAGWVFQNASRLLQDPFGLLPTYVPIVLLPIIGLGLAGLISSEVRQRTPGLGMLAAAMFVIAAVAAGQSTSAHAHHYRYIMTFYPLGMVFAVLGIREVGRLGTRSTGLTAGLAALVLVLMVVNLPRWVQIYAENSSDIYHQQTFVSRWINENIPPGSIVALNDAGAIAYYGGHPVYDLVGLVTNGASIPYRYGTGAVFERIMRLPPSHRPDYFAIFPNWFGLPWGETFREIFRMQLRKTSITGGDTMVVYYVDYTAAERSSRPSGDHTEGGEWVLVDTLNISDLQDEAHHDYRLIDLVPRGPGELTVLREYRPAGGPDVAILDGGRTVLGLEEFRVRTLGGKDLKLVMRTDAFFDTSLRVFANNKFAGTWDYGVQRDAWVEPVFIIPGSLVSNGSTRIRLVLDSKTGEDYAPFHYWFYQPR